MLKKLNLRKIRCELGITRTELAERIGVSCGTIKKWEDHFVFPRDRNLIKLIHVLGCDYEQLVTEVGVRE